MTLFERFRQWCARPLIEAQIARCGVLFDQHSVNCKLILERAQAEIYQQGYAAGQREEQERVFAAIHGCIAEREGTDTTEADIDRVRNFYRQ